MEYKVKKINFAPKQKPKQAEAKEDVASFEEATKEEIESITSLFSRKAKDEEDLKKKNTSTEFWFAVYFANEEQRNEFLQKVGLLDKMDDQYINGEVFANAVGVEVSKQKINTPKSFRKNKGFDKILM